MCAASYSYSTKKNKKAYNTYSFIAENSAISERGANVRATNRDRESKREREQQKKYQKTIESKSRAFTSIIYI